MFLLVPAHPGFPGQIPQSRKTVVLCVCVVFFEIFELLNLFSGLFSRTAWVSRYQKSRTILDFTESRDDGRAVPSAGPYTSHLHFALYR